MPLELLYGGDGFKSTEPNNFFDPFIPYWPIWSFHMATLDWSTHPVTSASVHQVTYLVICIVFCYIPYHVSIVHHMSCHISAMSVPIIPHHPPTSSFVQPCVSPQWCYITNHVNCTYYPYYHINQSCQWSYRHMAAPGDAMLVLYPVYIFLLI